MGLSVCISACLNEIDEERWEAVWLTSLQLLEQFPGQLASYRVTDLGSCRRRLYSPDYLFDVGKPTERWRVVGDLDSRRTAEEYELFRHLSQYGKRATCAPSDQQDILWNSSNDPNSGDIVGSELFGNKSQGYPFHYAMLAVGILLENSFPRRAVVHGDINRVQAERTVAWAEAVLGRRLALPIVTDPDRLWQRLLSAYAGDEKSAAQRFLALIRDRVNGRWESMVRVNPGPNLQVLRELFRAELGHYKQLTQIGALTMIRSLYQGTENVDLAIEWICGDRPAESGRSFPPTELLKVLCDGMLTIPLENRTTLGEFVKASANPMQTIDTVMGSVFATMAGMPYFINAYLDEDRLLEAFASKWPHQANEFRTLFHQRIQKQQQALEQTQTQIEKLAEKFSERATPSSWDSASPLLPSIPEAEFILEQLAEQRFDIGDRELLARTWGDSLREATQDPTWQEFETKSAAEFLIILTRTIEHTGIVLTESAWNAIKQASAAELQPLCLLAALPQREIKFWNQRIHLLESPDLWHHLILVE